MNIVGHCLLKNEENFVWYSINSVIKHLDKLIIWDTGSTDKTIGIIEEILKDPLLNSKIIFKKINLNKFNEGEIRQEMLDSYESAWIFVLDGDEIWWEESIVKLIETIKREGKKIESIVVPTINLVGDIFHCQDSSAGRYNLAGKTGHFNLRALNRNIPGLSSVGSHGLWRWVDGKKTPIQNRDKSKIKFIDAPYMHMTHLSRSSNDKNVYKRGRKLKIEFGKEFPLDYYYPEVLFRDRPQIVSDVWMTSGICFKLFALVLTPIKKIRRKFFMKGVRHGY